MLNFIKNLFNKPKQKSFINSGKTIGEMQNKPFKDWGDEDIIDGLEFMATLQLRTPLEILTINENNIKDKIYNIKNYQVMLDKDLAELYGVKPIRLREQIKRNITRFPDDFMFQLSEDEVDLMVSQNTILSRKYLGGQCKNIELKEFKNSYDRFFIIYIIFFTI